MQYFFQKTNTFNVFVIKLISDNLINLTNSCKTYWSSISPYSVQMREIFENYLTVFMSSYIKIGFKAAANLDFLQIILGQIDL